MLWYFRGTNLLLEVIFLLELIFVLHQPRSLDAATALIGGANIRIEKFDQCPDKLDMPNIFQGTRAVQKGLNDVTIDGSIIIRQPVVDPASLKVTLSKCASKDAPDTCEYYYTYAAPDFCKMVGMENMPWSSFWLQTTLPRKCPIGVGNYSMNNARIAMANVPNAPFLHGYWKIRSTGKSGGHSWHCAIAEFSLGLEVKARKRKHQG